MFIVNNDNSIYVTRGDRVCFGVTKEDNGAPSTFKAGDVVRIKVFAKKNCENVVLQKDFPVAVETEQVEIVLEKHETKIGEIISKPTDYWYEIELNPFTEPQTIVGYDEDGAKIFKLFPEGEDLEEDEPIIPEDKQTIDTELDVLSTNLVENQAIAKQFVIIEDEINNIKNKLGLE